MARENVLLGRLVSITSHYPCTTVLIWDTGVYFLLKTFKSDFVDNVKCNIPVKDVTKVNTVIGIGTTIRKFVDANIKYVFLPFVYYNLPTTNVRIFYPQNYHHLCGAHSIIKLCNVQMVLKNHNIVIPINILEANLPIIYNSYVTSAQNKRHGPLLISGMAFIGLDSLGFF